ncbi:conserved hypothetical protein [Leptospira interrogans serovar Manilae]|uniref:Uncharacterized protein n=1 Tax=Leptospira interrogans serovar Manilae TaxID=214675 RepID=A0AAQ1NZJ2_LEPIR|nr:conserved hypothetical protein [Leptospira interrogans serovar Manilae]
MLKNSIMGINKITSIVHFNATETNREFIFQQLYYKKYRLKILKQLQIT